MTAGHHRELAIYRLEQADEKLTAARVLLDQGLLRDSVSRSYYAMFSAARAMLAARRLSPRTHSGVITSVGESFVKTGEFSRESARHLAGAKEMREASEYSDFVEVSTADAEGQLADAAAFVEEAKKLVDRLLND